MFIAVADIPSVRHEMIRDGSVAIGMPYPLIYTA